MRGVDTNVLVRYLIGDHPEQSAKARSFMMHQDIFIGTTVLLECEWVLRQLYDVPKADMVALLRALAGLPNISVENPSLLAEALDRAQSGMDFADALHLGAAARCDSFHTFDRKFIKAAKGGALKVAEPQ